MFMQLLLLLPPQAMLSKMLPVPLLTLFLLLSLFLLLRLPGLVLQRPLLLFCIHLMIRVNAQCATERIAMTGSRADTLSAGGV
jgi:hypothetical protein